MMLWFYEALAAGGRRLWVCRGEELPSLCCDRPTGWTFVLLVKREHRGTHKRLYVTGARRWIVSQYIDRILLSPVGQYSLRAPSALGYLHRSTYAAGISETRKAGLAMGAITLHVICAANFDGIN